MKKRLLSFCLAVILCFQLIPIGTAAAADHSYSSFYDREYHWTACIEPDCGLEVEDSREPHSWDEDGISCTICGYGGHTTAVDWVNDTLTIDLIAALGDQLVAALYDETGKLLTTTMHLAAQDGSTQLTISGLENAKYLKVFSFTSDWQPSRPVLVQDLLADDVILQENNFAVTNIVMDGAQAAATLQATRDCVLWLAVYDETSDEMLQEQTVPVQAGDTQVSMTLHGLPEYFKLRAQLRNADGTGLHDTFVCLYYTSAFESFMNQTAADFPADRVLSFDGANNYAVLKEDVIRLDENSAVNRLVSRADGIAVFENVDETLTTLKAGDKLTFPDADGQWATAVISSITVSGDRVTITETTDSTVSDFFSSVKINATAKSGNEAEAALFSRSINMADKLQELTDVELGTALTFSPNLGPVSASASVRAGSKVICYYDESGLGRNSLIVGLVNRIHTDINITIGPTGRFEGKMPLGEIPLKGCDKLADLSVTADIPFSVDCSGGGYIPFSMDSSTGYLYIVDKGKESSQKIKDKNVTSGEFQLVGKIELSCGVRAAMQVGLLDDKVALSLGAGVGLNVNGQIAKTIAPLFSVQEYHACQLCISGSTEAYLEADINLDYKINDELSHTLGDIDLVNITWHINKFYLSVENDERSIFKGISKFGEGECPNKKYRAIISTWHEKEEVKGIDITLGEYQIGSSWEDEGSSRWTTHLYPGSYSASAVIRSNRAHTTFTITDSAQNVELVGRNKTITGYVTDQETGKPISGASVTANGPSTDSAVTNDAGSYELKVCDGNYVLNCAANNYAGRTANLSVSADTDQDFELRPLIEPGTLSGVVTDIETGKPISGASVTITSVMVGETYSQTISTDAAGAYSVTLNEGLYDVTFAAEHYKTVESAAGVDRNHASTLDQELERYRGSLSGTITATETEELKFTGANVSVTFDGEEVGSASTGADGIYCIDNLPSGDVHVTVQAQGFDTHSADVSIPDEDETVHDVHLYPSLGSGDINDVSWEVTLSGTLRIYGTGDLGGFNWNTYYGRPSTPWATEGLSDKILRVVVEEGVTSFGRYAFAQLPNLHSVELPDTLTSIGESSFKYCGNLTSISIPGSVTSINYDAFGSLENLKTVVFEPGATFVGGLQHSGVETVVIPDTVEIFGNYAFNGCSELTSINFPKNLKEIGSWAFNGSGITSANLPIGLETIKDSVFSSCRDLTTVFIPDTVTSIGSSTFTDCVKLSIVRLSPNVTKLPSFRRAESLRTLNVPEGVTFIGAYTLEGTNLSKLILPKSLETIDYCATNGCSSIPICYRGSQEEWAAVNISSNSNSAILDSTSITFNYQDS